MRRTSSCFPRSRSTRRSSSRGSKRVRRASTATARSSSPKACTTPTASSSPSGHAATRSATRSSAASAPVVANWCKRGARLQVPLGRGRLPAARRAPHRLEGRRRAGLRAWARPPSSSRSKGHERRDADDRAHVGSSRTAGRSASAPLEDVANVEKMLPRDFITAGRLRHHGQGPPLPRAADQGRGLPAVQGRPAAVRAARTQRARAAEAKTGPLWYSFAPFLRCSGAQKPAQRRIGEEIPRDGSSRNDH